MKEPPKYEKRTSFCPVCEHPKVLKLGAAICEDCRKEGKTYLDILPKIPPANVLGAMEEVNA